MKTTRSALVVGATGLVGIDLVKLLCNSEKYDLVKIIVRRPVEYSHPKLEVHICDFDKLTSQDIGEVQDVFCCMGTTIKKAGSREAFKKVDFEYPRTIAALAKKQGAEHFIIITAMGANEKSLSHYGRVKGQIEKELIAMDFLRLSILRPSLLTGSRSEFRLGERIGALVLKVINPIFVGTMRKYRSISGQQVAYAMKSIALSRNEQKVTIYPSDEIAKIK
ncbi:oxidoreductase [Paenibacillus sp. D2_2]|uniref:oxidoreductase n=1 Tax=Paenibacillus sp. D2_2 TaxID=3073092 RepID=UPI0028165711|nr:oxidoreductase [Paenibacillus sp. D2_2]WMT43186.1 oxidoreductase [Paenibacillus sp. D2_2]